MLFAHGLLGLAAAAGSCLLATPPARLVDASTESVQETDAEAATKFAESLELVSELLRKRKWKDAEEAVRGLLVEHAGATYVRPHLQGLRLDLRRAAFWREVDEPDPKTLIEGELLRYGASSGKIGVRYAMGSLGDFATEESAYVHPMHFAGPWTIEIEGTPEEVRGAAYFVVLEPGDGYLVQFGMSEKGALLYYKHTAHRVRGSEVRQLAEKDPPERRGKRKTVKAKLRVGRNSIVMSYNGSTALTIDKPEDGYGSLALIAPDAKGFQEPFGTITIHGEIDGGWIGGLLDEAMAERRDEFDATWEDPAEFLAWGVLDSDAVEESWSDLFGRLKFMLTFPRPAQQELFERVKAMLGKGRPQAASTLAQMDHFPEGALPDAVLAYLRLTCATELDRPTLALEQLPALEVQAGQEADFELFRADLLLRSGRIEESLVAFEEITQASPDSALGYMRGAEALLYLDRPEDAHRMVLRGLAVLPLSASLLDIESKIVKATKGPSWERIHEDAGHHFVVRTDANRKLAREARKVLDEAWERCSEFFGPLPEGVLSASATTEPQPHSAAYLFSGEASYLAYVQGVTDPGHENTLGVYSVLLKQIVAWNQPNVEGLWDTLRHEVAHRYLDLAIGERIPRWLNEGLAECFAACWSGEEFEPGAPRDRALEFFLAHSKVSSLRKFMTQTEEAFEKRGEAGYAQAWALVHFLRFGTGAPRQVHDRLMTGLREGSDPNLAVDQALRGVDLEALNKGFLEWLNAQMKEHRRRR